MDVECSTVKYLTGDNVVIIVPLNKCLKILFKSNSGDLMQYGALMNYVRHDKVNYLV